VTQYTLSVVETYDELSDQAADTVQAVVSHRPRTAITVPTGQTPVGMYGELVRRVRTGAIDMSQTQIFCLDDYLGKSRHDAASLTRWLFDEFLQPAGIPESNVHLIPATAEQPAKAAVRYEREIVQAGGLDLAVVGLGPNGHVAFNEPGSAPDSRTRVVDLTEESMEQSADYWESDEDIPAQAITMGLGTILEARQIVLIVSGASKADIVRRSLEEEPSLDVPGSWLRKAGDRLHVILDRDAATALETRPS
jgi:glucosamine-6-phosphate deaminase